MRLGVLITSAAAKVLLVQAFRGALAGRGLVVAADVRDDVASRFASDRFARLPSSSDAEAFLAEILKTCEAYDIGLVIPTRDAELALFAEHRGIFDERGIAVHVANPGTIRLCRDKLAFHAFCVREGFPAPIQVDPTASDLTFPLFMRPRDGSGGIGARRVDRPEDLPPRAEDVLLQECVTAPEYTVDLLRDLSGKVTVGAAVRRRIEVAGGESQRGEVVDHAPIGDLARAIGDKLELVGHNTLQFFDHLERGPLVIEVNPRFGGAANLGIAAGLDSPNRLLAMLAGDASALEPPAIRYGTQMFRYKTDFIVAPGGRTV